MQATLAEHMDIFDYEDLSFRKEFGKKLFLLGLRNGEPVLRMAEDDAFDRTRLYYLYLCDKVIIRASPRTTVTLEGLALKAFKISTTFATMMTARQAFNEVMKK